MNTVPFEVIALTETSYAVFREDLEKIAAHPETVFLMVGDAEETVRGWRAPAGPPEAETDARQLAEGRVKARPTERPGTLAVHARRLAPDGRRCRADRTDTTRYGATARTRKTIRR